MGHGRCLESLVSYEIYSVVEFVSSYRNADNIKPPKNLSYSENLR